MSDWVGQARRFLGELKRRNVYKVAVTYLAVAFVGIQAAQILVPPTTLPAWSDDLLIYLSVFGFPLSIILAWAFEVTPEGVRRTPAPRRSPAGNRSGRTRGSPAPDLDRGAERTGRSVSSDSRTTAAGRSSRREGGDTVALEKPAAGTLEILPARLELLNGEQVVDRIRFHRPDGDREPEFTIGRSPGPRDTHLRLDSPTVSRRHARIHFDGDQVVVVNESTTNPTRVNERPLVGEGTSTTLSDGDLIDMGEVRLRFRRW